MNSNHGFKVGATTVTRDGRPARIVSTDYRPRHGRTILAITTDRPGEEVVHSYYPDGRCFYSLGKPHKDDILPIKEPNSELLGLQLPLIPA